MNKPIVAALLLTAALVAPFRSHASSVLPAAHVLRFGTYGNGNVWVTLDQATDQPGCATPYLEFPVNGAANKAVLATAALAMATGATVTVQVDACLGPTGTFTGARNGTLFGINKP